MKLFTFTALLLTFVFQIHAQKCTDNTFNIEIKNKSEINYHDKNWDKYKSPIKFNSSVPSDRLYSMEYISIEKKNDIEKALIDTTELDTLKRGIAVCKIHVPSGKIVSISFLLQNKVEVSKMKKFKEELEQNTYFRLKLYARLKSEGYITQSFPIFVSRRKL